MSEHPVTLRLKIRPDLVERLDQLRKSKRTSMNEAINQTLTIALEAKETDHERTNKKH